MNLDLADATALRAHLDALNEAGVTPLAVGVAANDQPFLITLVGPYAEGEDVLFDSPWQTDRDYGERVDGVWKPLPPRCDECMAHVHGMEHLHFPVTVMAPRLTTAEREHYDRALAADCDTCSGTGEVTQEPQHGGVPSQTSRCPGCSQRAEPGSDRSPV